ncbi:LysR family transcriptional regulator [Saccharopolyspora terrae]|uniref:LysR family transcriptional regulator n=1 Tax=Saccharopolyspora terrae TaxID=2530384 RepID=A0A4R4VGM5_9PSEU|nr:LysR family transcriptional regulator [Saccharopolyspora terrae]TDD01843.1 LysR family transcriptional regulator [Saccharopolyspora terrae]
MQIAQLRAFVAALDENGFGAAAHVLGRTQSAISHAVAALEQELGAAVLRRSRDGVRATPLGEQILPRARAVLRQVEGIEEDARALRGMNRGRLRIAAFPTACQLLPTYIAALRRTCPGIEVVLWEGTDQEVERWIEEHLVDVGVRATLDTPGADELLLATDEMVAVVDPQHPLAAEPTVRLSDLTDDPMLVSDGGCEPLVDQLHADAGISLRIDQRVREMSTLLAMVREGLGVTVVPELSVEEGRGVVAIPLRPRARRHLTLVCATDPPTGPVLALRDLLRAEEHEAERPNASCV